MSFRSPAFLMIIGALAACGTAAHNADTSSPSAAGHAGAGVGGSSAGASSSAGSSEGGAASPSAGHPATSGESGSAQTPGGSDGAGGKTDGAGGSSESAAGAGAAGAAGNVELPPANAGFDYQIGGAYTPPSGVKVVSRDRGDAPATGLYNICYVNGFQAQPGEQSWWMSKHSDLILRDEQGQPIIDADWNEMLLDTGTDAKRQALAQVVGDWIRGCAADGFDAIEIDNLDSYSRSQGKLSQANNVAFMGLLSAVGHQAGLAMGQKNSSELLDQVAALGTDFAVVEECNRYAECADYKAAYADLVFIIEYRTQDFSAGCKNFPELSIVLRDRDVSTPGSSGYVYDGC